MAPVTGVFVTWFWVNDTVSYERTFVFEVKVFAANPACVVITTVTPNGGEAGFPDLAASEVTDIHKDAGSVVRDRMNKVPQNTSPVDRNVTDIAPVTALFVGNEVITTAGRKEMARVTVFNPRNIVTTIAKLAPCANPFILATIDESENHRLTWAFVCAVLVELDGGIEPILRPKRVTD